MKEAEENLPLNGEPTSQRLDIPLWADLSSFLWGLFLRGFLYQSSMSREQSLE